MAVDNLLQFENGFTEEDAKFKCNICEFTNADKGGMKRHIQAKHKMSGTKRGTDVANDSEEKRPKLDDDFEPSLASTQLMDDDRDEFEEVLLAEEEDLAGDSTVAGFSNTFLAKLGDVTGFDFENVDKEVEMQIHNETEEVPDSDIMKAINNADIAIAGGKIISLEKDVKIKDLVIAEKDFELASIKNDLETLTETISKANEDLRRKDDALETSLGKLNSLEEQLASSKSFSRSLEDKAAENLKRIQLLERALKKYINKTKADATSPNSGEASKLKALITAKNAEIKNLVDGKVTLANHLKEAQEKINGEDNGSIEKCTKLTNDLKSKSNQLKATEKERNELRDNVKKLQIEINSKNNKISHHEAENVKLHDMNNKLYEICKKSGVFEKLEAKNLKELDDQKKVYNAAENSEDKRYGNKPTVAKSQVKPNCWYYENGFCRKGARCSLNHPAVMCFPFWSTGACVQADACPNRHPVQVCIKFLNGTCLAGRNCVYQHPLEQGGNFKANSASQSSPRARWNVEHSPSSPMDTNSQPCQPNRPPVSPFFPNQHQQAQQVHPHPNGRSPAPSQVQGNLFGHPSQVYSGQGWRL